MDNLVTVAQLAVCPPASQEVVVSNPDWSLKISALRCIRFLVGAFSLKGKKSDYYSG